MVLRNDAGCWDLGYPRSVQRPDGKIVSVYYYNDNPNTERYVAATVWDPGPRRIWTPLRPEDHQHNNETHASSLPSPAFRRARFCTAFRRDQKCGRF